MQSHEPQQYKPNARDESTAPAEFLFSCPCLPRVLFVPTALSPPWAMQECRPKGLTHPHVMCKPKWIYAWSVVGRVIVRLDCGRWAFVGSDMLVHGNGLGLGIWNWKSPARSELLHSPGRKPWVRYWHTFIEPPTGAALPQRMQSHEPQLNKPNARDESAAPAELLFFCPCVPRVLFVPTALVISLNV